MGPANNHAILLIHCDDRRGLIANVTEFLSRYNGNIVDLDEHVEKDAGVFFMRVEWDLTDFSLAKEEIRARFEAEIVNDYPMSWEIHFTDRLPRMAIMTSKSSHCLLDILSRQYSGEWKVEIPLIISNHETHRSLAEKYGIPFHYFDIQQLGKEQSENQQMALLAREKVDFIVLARYMQILGPSFIRQFPGRIINIHHSFLPAFAGARPYHRAHERGVKIIGATSHYVTEELDEGPIIEQDVVKISHKDSIETLIRKGQDLEKIVLSRAVWHHLERKCLVYKNKTVVFD